MNSPRRFAGYACIALAFVLVGLVSLGVIDPLAGRSAIGSMGDLLRAMAPWIGVAFLAFVLGVWLVRGAR